MRADHTSNESILVRDINEYTDTIGRPCEDGGRDWGDVAANQGMPKIADNSESWERDAVFPYRPTEGTNPANILILDFRPPEP